MALPSIAIHNLRSNCIEVGFTSLRVFYQFCEAKSHVYVHLRVKWDLGELL